MPRDVLYVREWTLAHVRYRLEFIPASETPLAGNATEIQIPSDVILADSKTEGGYPGDLPIGIPDAATYSLQIDLRACDQSSELQDFRTYLTAPTNGTVTLLFGGGESREQQLYNVLTLYSNRGEGGEPLYVEFQGVQRELPGDEYGGDNAAQPNATVIAEFVFTHIVHHVLTEVRPSDVASFALNFGGGYGDHQFICNLAVYRPASESETAKSEGHYQFGSVSTYFAGLGKHYHHVARLYKLQRLFRYITQIADDIYSALLRISSAIFYLRGPDEVTSTPESPLTSLITESGTPHGVRQYHKQTYELAGTRGDALGTEDLYIIGEIAEFYVVPAIGIQDPVGGFFHKSDGYSIHEYDTIIDFLKQETEACGAKGVIVFPYSDTHSAARRRVDLWFLPYRDNPGASSGGEGGGGEGGGEGSEPDSYTAVIRRTDGAGREVVGSTWKAAQNAALLRGATVSLSSAGSDDVNEGTVRAHAAISETDYGLDLGFHNVPYLGSDFSSQNGPRFNYENEFNTDLFRGTYDGFQTRGIYYLDAAVVSGVHLTKSNGMGGYYEKPFMVHHEFGTYAKLSDGPVYYEPGYTFLPFKVDSVSSGYLPTQIRAMQRESTALIHAAAFYYLQFADSTQKVVTYELDMPFEVMQPAKIGYRFEFEIPSGNFFLRGGAWLGHLSGKPWVISCSADHTTGMVTVTLYSRE